MDVSWHIVTSVYGLGAQGFTSVSQGAALVADGHAIGLPCHVFSLCTKLHVVMNPKRKFSVRISFQYVVAIGALVSVAGCNQQSPTVEPQEQKVASEVVEVIAPKAATVPEIRIVDGSLAQDRNGLAFMPNEDVPLTGLAVEKYPNGQMKTSI